MSRDFLVIGNWKANLNRDEIDRWAVEIAPIMKRVETPGSGVTVAVAPPFPFLDYFKQKTTGVGIQMAAQDVSAFPSGSYTGEVTAPMLTDLGVKFVFIGHSERRRLLGENPALIEKKVAQAITAGMIPVIGCQTIEEIPGNIRNFAPEQLILMYEPAEAISDSSGFHPIAPEKIRQVTTDWSTKMNLPLRIIYGGSVNHDLIGSLKEIPGLCGVGVGRASLDARKFSEIIDLILV